ncbi:unnamed protein product [Effrenium voratum]|uniref:Uncharacterized protein n=1 Tax=Effrenium voratum TaxID=2562239 RepID=A0AA36NF95_9DINO|nr:unnamed protein product [Effrenium voratum]CAJ1399983.1 unnamed protein product [Effrenium voratum]CAJ1438036.1 unnamed protein product [Effrenium voratum]
MSSSSSSASGDSGALVRPKLIPEAQKRSVREVLQGSGLKLERRRGYVRPCELLPDGGVSVVKHLGECGDKKCGNYRLGQNSQVRPDFLKFCVDHIKSAFGAVRAARGLVYCSLGSGQLLFDWELLEHLTQKENFRLKAIHLIDTAYGGSKLRASAVRAQRIFAGWFAESGLEDTPCPVRSFLCAKDFQRWAEQRGEEVDILLDCDAVSARKVIDVAQWRSSVLRHKGLCLVLSNPAKRICIQRRTRRPVLRELAKHVFKDSTWEPSDGKRSRDRRSKRERQEANL